MARSRAATRPGRELSLRVVTLIFPIKRQGFARLGLVKPLVFGRGKFALIADLLAMVSS